EVDTTNKVNHYAQRRFK
ncbi:hypothetical protein VCHENC02_5412B, partial [Vibrio harveyi]